MPKKSLVDYVKSLLQKGYNASAIRNILLKYSYTNEEISDAISSAYLPTIRHEIHLSHATISVIIFIFISLLGISSFFYFGSSEAKTQLLDLNLEPITTTAEPGKSIVFLKELSNLGSSKRYDVVIRQEIIEPKTGKSITQKIETRAIETFGSTQTKILIPEDAKTGDYMLRAVVEYGSKKAVATLPVKIAAFAKAETCFDGIKNQNEIGIDCGGICAPCEKQGLNCDDGNACTKDVMENGACSNKPIIPCCGNNICEEQEICAADCKKTEAPSLTSTGSLEEIKELARSSPGKALQQCSQIDIPDLKDTCIANIGEVQHNKNYCMQTSNSRIRDLCYSNIAKSINDNSLCESISIDGRKDSCYMGLVLDNRDYSVCGRITNRNLRQSCESLRQLNEMNEKAAAQAQSSTNERQAQQTG